MDPRPRTMLAALALAARRARANAGVRRDEIAVRADVDPSTVRRFEHARAWPQHPEELIGAYAAAVGITPRELWEAALNQWPAP